MSYHEYESSSMNTTTTDGGNTYIQNPGKHDVLFGRGGAINKHAGNQMFRKVVNEQKEDYFNAPKSDKPKIARRVVSIVRNLTPPGRFLAPVRAADKNCKDNDGSILWRDVGDKKARAKASQCLREKKVDTPVAEPLRFETGYHSEPGERKGSLGSFNAFEEEQDHDMSHSFFPDHRQNQAHFSCNQQTPAYRYHPSSAPTQYNTHYPHSSQMQSVDYFHKPPIVQPVTPCDQGNRKHCTHFSQEFDSGVDYTHQQPKPQSSEMGHMAEHSSWIGSFCSLETQLIEEGESMSLTPPRPLKAASQQTTGNFPLLHAASWASSDVGSELTDNSHIEDFCRQD